MRVLPTREQIAFPVAWDRALVHFGRPFPIDTASTICPRVCPCVVDVLPRRMMRLLRRCDISSFFRTPRAWINRLL